MDQEIVCMYIFRKLIITFLVWIISFSVRAVHDYRFDAGKSAAMAGSSLGVSNIWSVYTNQASMAFLDRSYLGVFHQSGYIRQQNMQGIAFVKPTQWGSFAASYSYYGYNLYNEMQGGIAYAKLFSELFAVGVKFNYLHTHVGGEYQDAQSINFELGIIARLSSDLYIGAHAYNPANIKLDKQKVPAVFSLGVAYLFSDKLLITAESELDGQNDLKLRLGLDYHLVKFASIQVGVCSKPTNYSFGASFHVKSIDFSLGFKSHQHLGYTPSLTLVYGF